ncbi:hypothetical protein M0813_06362 [Anaeramoeba flamelloides]|uniref:PH domain-containing protein n=1 Tax=Anaeramoeba flamelloides TaxID=1746091 RepID=A0ABQ8XFD6_9EUKA|nr:hypothetical protein M0813_06362 [Anaeramoeba flamelloides]
MTKQHDRKGNKCSHEEFHISKYSCALKEKRGFLRQGTLLVTTKNIHFTSNIFGIRKRITIPITSKLVIIKKTLLFFPNSLLISNTQNPEGWFFTSFFSRDKCYQQTTKIVSMFTRDEETKKKKKRSRHRKIKVHDKEKTKKKTKYRRIRKRRVSQPISKIDKSEIAKIKNEFLRERRNENSQNEQNSNGTEVLMENEKSTNKKLLRSVSENELLKKKKRKKTFSTTDNFKPNTHNSQGSEKILKRGILEIYNKIANEWLQREIIIYRNNESIVFRLSKIQPKKKIIGDLPVNFFKKCKLESELNFNIKLISGKVIRLKAKDKLDASNWINFLNSFLIGQDQNVVFGNEKNGNEKNGNKNITEQNENKNDLKNKSLQSKMIALFLKGLCILKSKMIFFTLFFLTSLNIIGKFSFVSAQTNTPQDINNPYNNKIYENNLGSNLKNNNLFNIVNKFINLNN